MKRRIKTNQFSRSFISMILSFFLSINITLIMVCAVFSKTFINQNFLENRLEKSNYYSYLLERIHTDYESLAIPSGFDKEFMLSLITKDMVKKDILKCTHLIFNMDNSSKTKITVNIGEGIYEHIYDKLKENSISRNIKITEKVDESLKYLTDNCVDSYINVVKFPFIDQVQLLISKLVRPINLSLIVLLVVLIFILCFLILIHPKNKCNASRYIIYSLSAAFLFLISIYFLLLTYKNIKRVAIKDKAFYYFFTDYMYGVFHYIGFSAILILILTFVVACFYVIKSRKEKLLYNKHSIAPTTQ